MSLPAIADSVDLMLHCVVGAVFMIASPVVMLVAVHAWLSWDWISKVIWTVGSIAIPLAAAATFIRVGMLAMERTRELR